MDKLLIWFVSLVLFDTFLIHLIHIFPLSEGSALGQKLYYKEKRLTGKLVQLGREKKMTARSPQGFNKYLWSIFSLITPTSCQSPVSCYLKCQRKLFLGLEGTMYSKNERVKSKYDCHKDKQDMRENMSSKIDQLIQRTPTRQVDESYTLCGQSSCWMENTLNNTTCFPVKANVANKLK